MSAAGVRAQRAAEAARLHDEEGLNGLQIAERMRLSRAYAYALLKDPTGDADAARKESYGGTCGECGARTTGNNGRAAAPEYCADCAPEAHAIWTRDAIVCAIQWWADEHGGIPPSSNDWNRARGAGDDRVCTVANVIRRFGTWNAAIRAAGFQPHHGGPLGGYTPLAAEQRQECARRYAAGESSLAIAADLGCHPGVVLKWVRRAGVAIREPFARRAAA